MVEDPQHTKDAGGEINTPYLSPPTPNILLVAFTDQTHWDARGKGTLVMHDIEVNVPGHRAELRRQDYRGKEKIPSTRE